jgi:DNA polymerase III epsilon subunit-like protein
VHGAPHPTLQPRLEPRHDVQPQVPSDRPLHEVAFCVLDLETTGTDPSWDEITEIGAIVVQGGERQRTFHSLVAPGQVDALLPSLLEFLGDTVLTGHNVGFDVRFLNAALGRTERTLLDPTAVVDTMYLARALLRDDVDDCRLGTLAERFGFEHRPTHRAFEDAAATVDLLHLLIERAWGFGATTLDDLHELPKLAGHRWAAKLRRTERLPRRAGVFTCHAGDGRVVWVGAADLLRRDMRAMFARTGTSVHASVLRDTETWRVVELDDPLARAVAVERLLHRHRPRPQRGSVTGDRAAHVLVVPGRSGWRARASRVPVAGAHALGPLPDRADAAAAAVALQRLAQQGVSADEVLAWVADGSAPDRLHDPAALHDPVAAALLRRDRDALHRLVEVHGVVAHHRCLGLFDVPGLPDPAATLPPPTDALPLDLLSEVLLLAEHPEHRSAAGTGDHRRAAG